MANSGLSKEEKRAFEVVEELDELEKWHDKEDAHEKELLKRRRADGGKRGQDAFSSRARMRRSNLSTVRLPGVNTDKLRLFIQQVVSMEYSGMYDEEIAEAIDSNVNTIRTYRIRYREAFEEVRKSHMSEAMRQYHLNIMRVKSAASEAGLRAIVTLQTLMEDKDTPAGVRKGAADAILKVIGAHEKIAQEAAVKREFLSTITGAYSGEAKDAPYILEAEFEDDDGEDE